MPGLYRFIPMFGFRSMSKAGGSGSLSGAIATFTVNFINGTATPSKGDGTYTYDRLTASATVEDFEGWVRETEIDQIGYIGQREVQNRIIGSATDLTNGSWQTAFMDVDSGEEDPDGGSTAYKLTALTGGTSQFFQQLLGGNNDDWIFSIWIKRLVGTGDIDLWGGTTATDITSEVTTSWQRFRATDQDPNTAVFPIVQLTDTDDEIAVWHPMMERVNGSTIGLTGIPSEWINIGTDHGTGSSFTKSFVYLNGNVISGTNIVDETGMPGATIATSINKGLSSWEERTNLHDTSVDISNSSDDWNAPIRATVGASQVDIPNGRTSSLVELIEDGTGPATHFIAALPTVAGSSIYTFSIYAKRGNSVSADRNIAFRLNTTVWDTGGNGNVVINLDTGATTDVSGTPIAHGSEDAGNGWYRLWVTTDTVASPAGDAFQINMADTGNNISYTGNSTSSVYLWGAQMELGSYPTPLIFTNASTETRNISELVYDADNYSENGWCLAEFDVSQEQLDNSGAASGFARIMSMQNADFSEFVSMYIETGDKIRCAATTTGTQIAGEHVVTAGHHKVCMTWQKAATETMRSSADGGAVDGEAEAADRIPNTADVTTIVVGAIDISGTFSKSFNGTIAKLTFGKTFLTDAELQAKST